MKYYNVTLYEFNTGEQPESIEVNIDFETFEPTGKIMETDLARSGTKVAFVNHEIAFSETYKEGIKGLSATGVSKIEASAWVYFSEPSPAAKLVLTLESLGKSIEWKAVDVAGSGQPGTWNQLEIDAMIPFDVDDETIVKIYLWNQGKTQVLMDDLQIKYE
jgi:hypothetical protein